jgi:hypothetical protein
MGTACFSEGGEFTFEIGCQRALESEQIMEAEKAENRDEKTGHEKPHIVDFSIPRWIGGIDMRVEC